MGVDLVLGAGLVLKSTAKLGAHFNHGEGVSLHAELPGLSGWVNTGNMSFFYSTLLNASYFCHPDAIIFHMESLSLAHGQLFKLMFLQWHEQWKLIFHHLADITLL